MTIREQARVNAGISVEQAAKWANVQVKHFRRLERNPHLPMNFAMSERLAKAYKCPTMVFTRRRKDNAQ